MSELKLILLADETRRKDFLRKSVPGKYGVVSVTDPADIFNYPDAKGIFILKEFEPRFTNLLTASLHSPVFINSINATFDRNLLKTCWVRVNSWPGFFCNPVLEISSPLTNIDAAEILLDELGWPFKRVADQPGMFTPRVIAMIINEACFAIQDKVSTKAEIDIAMKLGTNYPFGPFEWAQRIGTQNIYSLLVTLSKTDKRYQPARDLVNILQSPG